MSDGTGAPPGWTGRPESQEGPGNPSEQASQAPAGQPFPPQAGFGAAAGFPSQAAPQQQWQFQPPAASSEPDWEALASQHEASSRRKKLIWTGAIVAGACVLGGAVGLVVMNGVHKGDPQAGPSASASASPRPSGSGAASAAANSPTVPGQPELLADKSGQSNIAMGPDAQVSEVQGGYALRLRSNGNSFAQSANQVIDVTKSFSISAWVYNEAPGGSRTAISEGDGISYSFDLARDDANGKKAWVFRVQTADGGADGTVVQAVAPDTVPTVGQWALLTGVYDAGQKSITLYVNGAQAATAKLNGGIWAGPGPLQLGRSRHHGIWGGSWAGVIGRILVWDEPLNPQQVASLKTGGTGLSAKPAGSWLVGG
ncbi:LamG domain-containing protein [Kitasatospora sp. NPDC085879]|uniref:LamG domain-containing protein n=1 Tax=Kitasatospora sp. NPDC085879 TaxID=3154769 RepID=UPI00343BFB57